MGSRYKGSKSEVQSLDTFIKLMRASETIRNNISRFLTAYDLTDGQFGILEAVYHLGTLSQKDLGEKILRSGGNITLVVDNLEASGYVKRIKDPDDRRIFKIHLTGKGEKLVKKIMPLVVKKIQEEFALLDNEELNELQRLCRKIGLKN